jgi:hypothetical protein
MPERPKSVQVSNVEMARLKNKLDELEVSTTILTIFWVHMRLKFSFLKIPQKSMGLSLIQINSRIETKGTPNVSC